MTLLPMRSNYGVNRFGVTGDDDYVVSSTYGNAVKRPLIFCHAAGGSAIQLFNDLSVRAVLNSLVERYTICISDMGGPYEWGNAKTTTCITNIKSMLQTQYGAASGKVGLMCVSMGGGAAFNYALANPTTTAFVAGVVPLVNVHDLRFYNSTAAPGGNDGVTYGSFNDSINTAYGGAYSNATYGATRNTYVYKDSYPATQVRTGIWYSETDAVVRPQFTQGLIAAQPAIESWTVADASNVGYGHGEAVQPIYDGFQHPTRGWPKWQDWINARYDDSF